MDVPVEQYVEMREYIKELERQNKKLSEDVQRLEKENLDLKVKIWSHW